MALLTGNGSNLGASGLTFASAPALSGISNNSNLSGLGVSFSPTGDVRSPEQTSFINSVNPTKLNATIAPTSPITKKPIGGFGTVAPTVPAGNTQLGAGIADATYNFLPGETADAYNARISAYNAQKQQAGTLAPSDHFGGATPTTLSNGGIATTNQYGQVTSPNGFSIDTSTGVPSSALAGNFGRNDVNNARKSYADYVQGLAQAQQYSPDYVNALNAVNQAKARGAELSSNFYTGNNLPGDTLDFAQGFTSREQALNDVRSLGANQALQVQELVRQGNIAAAKALVDASSPTSVSAGSSLVNPLTGDTTYNGLGGYQAIQGIQTVNNLAQTYPDAGILPTDTLAVAQQKASQSPSFSSKQLVQVTLPGGGIQFVNKNQLQTNPDGTYTILSTAQGASNKADAESLATQQSYADTITRSLSTADTNFQALTNLMQKAGINDAQTPIINQLSNKLSRGLIGNGDVAAFYSSIANLQAEYAQVLSKGGAVTDSVRKEADQLIPNDLNLTQLRKVQQQINLEGKNAVNSANAQVQAIKSRLSTPTTSATGNSIWDF